jgi:hypothetical protein
MLDFLDTSSMGVTLIIPNTWNLERKKENKKKKDTTLRQKIEKNTIFLLKLCVELLANGGYL